MADNADVAYASSCPLPSEEDTAVSVEQSGNIALEQPVFIPPVPLVSPSIIIEFCDRVRSVSCQGS